MTGLFSVGSTGISQYNVNQAESSASMLEKLLLDDLRKGEHFAALDRAREVDELVKLHLLETSTSLKLQLLMVKALELGAQALNDEYSRKVDYYIGNIFATGQLPAAVKGECERFRVRIWLNRGNLEQARYFVNRLDRRISVVGTGPGQRAAERAEDDESKITAPTWLLLAEVALFEGQYADARRALDLVCQKWFEAQPTSEEQAYHELLTALIKVRESDPAGVAMLARLYDSHVTSESALERAMRSRISAAAGFMTSLDGVSSLEAERWKSIGPEDHSLIEAYLTEGLPSRLPNEFAGLDGEMVTDIIDRLIIGEPGAKRAGAGRLSLAYLEAASATSSELPADFGLDDKRLDNQTDILGDENATGPLVIDWSGCDRAQLFEAVTSHAISDLVLRVTSGSIFMLDGFFVDAVFHTEDEELLRMSPRDVIFELYRIALARLPRSRARQLKKDIIEIEERARLNIRPRDFNFEVCRRIDVMNAKLMGIELAEEDEERDPFEDWNPAGPIKEQALETTSLVPSPVVAAEVLEPFEAIFEATTVKDLCGSLVKSVNEIGLREVRVEVTAEDEKVLIASSGVAPQENLSWSALDAGPLRLRLGVIGVSSDYQRLMRMMMDAAAHRLRLMPGAHYRGRVIEAPNMIASDSRTQELLETVRTFAGTDKNILVSGERGTGKDRIAHLIHEWSPRASKPFVSVDAGILNTPDLLAAELFGSVKGSYTGSTADKKGLVHSAEGGILFIDEIDEGESVQSVLKRFAQFGTYKTVGQAKESAANVRLIIATNRIGEGEVFIKEDLRDRFWEIRVPPLRERRGDIRPLAEYFAMKHEKKVLPDSVLCWLETLEWPGNIRQLENVIERACLLAKKPSDLTLKFFEDCVERCGGKTIIRMSSDDPSIVPLQPGETLKERLLRHEKEYFTQAMKSTGGNKTKTAELLGLHRSSVHTRIRQLGLEDDGMESISK